MTTDLSKYDASQLPSADVLGRQRYAIIVADWNSEITYAMAQGALDTLLQNGVDPDNIDIRHVPGTVELTFAAARVIEEEPARTSITSASLSPKESPSSIHKETCRWSSPCLRSSINSRRSTDVAVNWVIKAWKALIPPSAWPTSNPLTPNH